jgi:hypothetical protein
VERKRQRRGREKGNIGGREKFEARKDNGNATRSTVV